MSREFKDRMEEFQYFLRHLAETDQRISFESGRPVDILLIEDSPVDAEFFKAHLATANEGPSYRVVQVKRLSKAFNLLNRHSFKVIVLDLNLPDSNDFSSIAKLRANFPATPIVVLTGNDDYLAAIKSLRAGAQDYLVKGRADGEIISHAIQFAMNRF